MTVPLLKPFYITGGTLPADAGSYVVREADTQLFEALVRGEFCYVLNTRQMGKSSLMVRTANRLKQDGIAVVGLDITAVGQNVTPTEWYDGLLALLAEQLQLEDLLEPFWESNTHLGPMQRFIAALQQVVLPNVPGPIVIFVDEIDAVRSLPFSSDEFFAGIRECYNRRALDSTFQRLTFCLLGVATPADLITDVQLSPFNIGRRIPLHDFTFAEAVRLAAGMENGNVVLRRVLYWTGGNPYMTQRLCQAVVEFASLACRTVDDSDVDRLCRELFLTKSARESDDNLAFVRNRMLKSEADIAAILEIYDRVWNHKRVPDDPTNPLTSTLKLSGVVRDEGGYLQVRNRIFETIFDHAWVRENMPFAELRRQRAAYRKGLIRAASAGIACVVALGSLTFLAISNARIARREERLQYLSAHIADAQRKAAQEANARAEQLAAERQIALDAAVVARNHAKQEQQRADAAQAAIQQERQKEAEQKKRADTQARVAQAMARAFAAKDPTHQKKVAMLTGVSPEPRPGNGSPEDLPGTNNALHMADAHAAPFFSPDEGKSDLWLFFLQPANAYMSVHGGVTLINIDAIDESDWHVEAVHPAGRLVEGAAYLLTFRAKADSPRDMEINIQVGSGNYHSLVEPRPHAHLTTTWKTFQFTVRPQDVGEENQVSFIIGSKVGLVWLKNVNMKRVAV
jgi:hypothetical protein